jgi:gas vesicle protein
MGKSNGKIKVTGFFLFGSLAGVALGMLFAPDKGKKTRHMIATEAKEITEQIEGYTANLVAGWTDALKEKTDGLRTRFAVHNGNHHPA